MVLAGISISAGSPGSIRHSAATCGLRRYMANRQPRVARNRPSVINAQALPNLSIWDSWSGTASPASRPTSRPLVTHDHNITGFNAIFKDIRHRRFLTLADVCGPCKLQRILVDASRFDYTALLDDVTGNTATRLPRSRHGPSHVHSRPRGRCRGSAIAVLTKRFWVGMPAGPAA